MRGRSLPVFNGLGQNVMLSTSIFRLHYRRHYLYVSDPQTLHSFYNDLTNRILNQYTITFEAEDTLSVDRTLKVSIESDTLAYDMVRYSLQPTAMFLPKQVMKP